VTFDTRGITSNTWESYPILRFEEVPTVEVRMLSRPEMPPMGTGECSTGPTIAAIANNSTKIVIIKTAIVIPQPAPWYL